MAVQTFSKVFGALFLLVGILDFFISSVSGVLQFDPILDIIYIITGLWGLYASRELGSSGLFAKVIGVFYLLIGILGFIVPGMFGLFQVLALNNVIHLIIGGWAAYLGYKQ
ncbi:DUF4383 domain-containing protein [Brevibacillus massiliensis]|uniref:DUF4383 domain-containing protein n=1 Tax=Brevibacillus massiliensis TaxID=1118054 RepID=UPI0002F8D457|nr:DUF4383 domain-containing protein [Brevibacillus massiliensis]